MDRARLTATLRLLSALTLVAVAAVFAATAAADAASGRFDSVRDPISYLAATPGGWGLQVAFVLGGLAVMALAWGLRTATGGPEDANGAALLLGIGGLAVVGVGLVRADLALQPSTPRGWVHAILAALGFGALVAGILWFSADFRRDRHWAGWSGALGLLALACTGMLVTTAVVAGIDITTARPAPTGLMERVLAGLLLAWCLVASIRLWRLAPRTARRVDRIRSARSGSS